MWFIEGQVTRRGREVNVRTWLKPGTTLTLGRQDNDPDVLCVGTDVNVSRRHVALTTTRTAPSTLTIRDLSQNGVFLDGVRIKRQEETPVQITNIQPLRPGVWGSAKTIALSQIETEDQEQRSTVAGSGYGGSVEMTIGNMKFKLERVDFSVAFAGMSSSEKVEASQLAADMDIKVEPKEWVPGISTHLLMSSSSSPRAEQFRLSEKVYQALAQGGHIITMAWLRTYRDALLASTKTRYELLDPPLELSYLPKDFKSLTEVSGIHWSPNFKRKSLFDHLIFVLLSQDAKASKWEACIQSAGGAVVKEDPMNVTAVIRRCLIQDKKEPVFIKPTSDESFVHISRSVEPVLKEMGYRWVETREIGMAILAVSTDQFCNPKYQGALPTLDDRLTNASSLPTFSTLDHRHSSLMQPLPEESATISIDEEQSGMLTRKQTVVVKEEEEALLPSLGFDDFFAPRRGKTSFGAAANSSTSSSASTTKNSPLSTAAPVPATRPALQQQPAPTTVTASAKSTVGARDTTKKRRRLDMFLDDDDDIIIMDPGLQVPTALVPEKGQQQRLPTVARVNSNTASPTSDGSSARSSPGSGSAVTITAPAMAATTTTTGASNRPIMLDSDDDFDFGLPSKRRRAKKDGGSGGTPQEGGSGRDSASSSVAVVVSEATAAASLHALGADDDLNDRDKSIGGADEEETTDDMKLAVMTDTKGLKRRKILLAEVDSPPSKSSDMFDDLGEGEEEIVKDKQSKTVSAPTTKKGQSSLAGSTATAATTASGRRKLGPVQQDISTYHIEDRIHHQRELDKYEHQEAALAQRREMDRLAKEYERATSVQPKTTMVTTQKSRSSDAVTSAAEAGKKQPTTLMTVVFSDRLLDKGKRRKLLTQDDIKQEEEEEEGEHPHSATFDAMASPSHSSTMQQRVTRVGEQVASLSLRGQRGEVAGEEGGGGGHPEWPERWKKMPNFKARPPVDPVLVEKWKGRPNFKAFRRTTMPGIPMINGPHVPLTASQR
ncbi:hypothetical protein DFQ27_009469 [Actinomortierella ambigua]|uniref:FHA domain-containing protein n=1 Tax=Actinomortierella ambigua TaxID=1343610 RepID=A0A9P6TWK9_9FUNG|nr:hypothetical protein DFQ27_009469 [Actinomortierella ambigua]